MTASNTPDQKVSSSRVFFASAAAIIFLALGVASGLWIQLGILAVAVGIFFATVRMRPARIEPSNGGRGARVITLTGVELDPEQEMELEEVA